MWLDLMTTTLILTLTTCFLLSTTTPRSWQQRPFQQRPFRPGCLMIVLVLASPRVGSAWKETAADAFGALKSISAWRTVHGRAVQAAGLLSQHLIVMSTALRPVRTRSTRKKSK